MERTLPRWLSVQFFLAFFSLLLVLYMFLLEPFWVVTENVILPGSRLQSPLPSGSFLFLSDFHSTGFGFREKKALSEADRLSPSFVLLGGGYGGDSSLESIATLSK
jgi:predicted MPP superfamily phosphohydrolase